MSNTKSLHSLGNNLIVFSVALFEPNSPYFELYPFPSIEEVKISSNPQTAVAPFANKILFVLALVWMSQHNTLSV